MITLFRQMHSHGVHQNSEWIDDDPHEREIAVPPITFAWVTDQQRAFPVNLTAYGCSRSQLVLLPSLTISNKRRPVLNQLQRLGTLEGLANEEHPTFFADLIRAGH